MNLSKKKKIRVLSLSLMTYILIIWTLDAYQIHFPFMKAFLYFGYAAFMIAVNYQTYMNYKAKKEKKEKEK